MTALLNSRHLLKLISTSHRHGEGADVTLCTALNAAQKYLSANIWGSHSAAWNSACVIFTSRHGRHHSSKCCLMSPSPLHPYALQLSHLQPASCHLVCPLPTSLCLTVLFPATHQFAPVCAGSFVHALPFSLPEGAGLGLGNLGKPLPRTTMGSRASIQTSYEAALHSTSKAQGFETPCVAPN